MARTAEEVAADCQRLLGMTSLPGMKALANEAAALIRQQHTAIESAVAAMEALHPSNTEMTDQEYANLWNATLEALQASLRPDGSARE